MIVPAILTNTKDEFTKMIDICSGFANYAQIDIMDGKFVPSKSIELTDLDNYTSPIECEAHLMVSEPSDWILPFKKIGAKRILYHFEINADHLQIIDEIRKLDLSTGIAVNPATTIDDFKYLVAKIDAVLFMSVNPGFYGAPFIPDVLKKIKEFKSIYPDKIIGIDGGIKLDNLLKVKESGVDYICVGSAILKNINPGQSYQEFQKLLHA